MIKYLTVACALKMFSISTHTRKLYRSLGNTMGANRCVKAGLPELYIHRAKTLLGLFEKYGLPQKGAKLLELGTGFVHWESTVARLFYDAKITLFDVWDNRQFPAFKTYFSEFLNVFDNEITALPSRHNQARQLLETILSLNSFAELYELLGFQYVIEPTGSLKNLDRNAFDACYSANVMEHVDRTILPEYLKDLYQLLKPGGRSFMRIDISDHLANYDPGVCRKRYMKYSDAVWRLCFENQVQYFNRIQRPEWLSLFSRAGFELLEENSVFEPIHTTINKQYQRLDRKDIECTVLNVVHRRPLDTM